MSTFINQHLTLYIYSIYNIYNREEKNQEWGQLLKMIESTE